MSETKFRQIAHKIEQRIDQGEYPIHSKLPPHRILADDLDTTPTTIAKAYNLLAEKGRVESFVGRGTFVKPLAGQADSHDDENAEYNFSIIQPYLASNLPYLQKAMEKASRYLDLQLLSYADQSGHEAHRKVGVTWAKHYGLEGGSVHNTVLTNGAQHGLSLLILMLTDVGDTIAVESHTYPGLIAVAKLLGRKLVGVELDERGMSPESLRYVIAHYQPKVVVVTPSHQNPIGVSMDEVRRKEIAEVIEYTGRWLIEDDVFGFLNPQPISAITNYIPHRAFHLSSLSKAISPSLRCGFLKLPDSMVSEVNAHLRANVWLASPVGYATADQLIETRDAFRLARNQRQLAERRQALAQEILGPQVRSTRGYHVWLPLPNHWSPEAFVMEAKNLGILLQSGNHFSVSGIATNYVRLSLMSISSEARFKQGLQMLKTLLASEMHAAFPF